MEELVAGGVVVCPIEGTGLMEWLRQADTETRAATLSLMGRFSKSVCLAPPLTRTYLEACYLLYKNLGHQWEKAPKPEDLVWTRPYAIFGLSEPDNPSWTQEERDAIQVEFERHAWQLGLREVFSRIASLPLDQLPKTARSLDAINEGIRQHAHELRSFPQTLGLETRGGLEAVEDVLKDAWRYVFLRNGGDESTATDEQLTGGVRDMIGLLGHAALQGKIGTVLPSITISSALHAAIRWDKRREFAQTDLEDFAHASAALPYCDLFLTDRALAASLTASHLQLDRRFGIRVAAKTEDAVAALHELLR